LEVRDGTCARSSPCAVLTAPSIVRCRARCGLTNSLACDVQPRRSRGSARSIGGRSGAAALAQGTSPWGCVIWVTRRATAAWHAGAGYSSLLRRARSCPVPARIPRCVLVVLERSVSHRARILTRRAPRAVIWCFLTFMYLPSHPLSCSLTLARALSLSLLAPTQRCACARKPCVIPHMRAPLPCGAPRRSLRI
jgi:hypothetical protein